jgi:Flp pilus assembly protein TadD
VLLAACSPGSPDSTEPAAKPAQLEFVGSERCAECHESEYDNWLGSHHQLAMQAASGDSMLGDFSGITVPYYDTDASFYTRDGDYFIRLQDAGGDNAEYRVTHTFGVVPLQQYLVDGPGGRKLVPQFAWDSRAAAEGGQRWYHLYPDEFVGPGDPLHWTGRYFTWNTMCAECHSTDLQVNYDPGTDTFATTFKEVSVGCESCHGQGSVHVAQAESGEFDASWGLPVDLDDRGDDAWVMNVETGIAELSGPGRRQQPESCGRCHARRAVIARDYEFGRPLTDTHMPALLDEYLYYADGRIQDEVYVYGSFLQSRMYAAGVTCSDCHEPHSAQLRAGANPNDICATCHLADRFATVEHSETGIGDCVTCHMPATTYMGVDDRRDHSFRLPGTSDDPDHYGAVVAAGRDGGADDTLLAGIANVDFPDIARATMLTLLQQPAMRLDTLSTQLAEPSPLLRIAALRTLLEVPVSQRGTLGSNLLRDPVRGVRIQAARTFIGETDLLDYEDVRALTRATAEYRDSLEASLFWPESAVQLAELESRDGNLVTARRYYEHALRLDHENAAAHYAYGLFLVRNDAPAAALDHIGTAARLAPDIAIYAYVHGVALNSTGNSDAAVGVLADARRRFPDDFDIAWALVTIRRDRGEIDMAHELLREMRLQFPDRPQVDSLAQALGI